MATFYVVMGVDGSHPCPSIKFILQDQLLAGQYAETLEDGWVEEYNFGDDIVRLLLGESSSFYVFEANISQDYSPNENEKIGERHSDFHVAKRDINSSPKKTNGCFVHCDNIDPRNNHYRLKLQLEIILSNAEDIRFTQKIEWHDKSISLFEQATDMFFHQNKNPFEIDDWLKKQLNI